MTRGLARRNVIRACAATGLAGAAVALTGPGAVAERRGGTAFTGDTVIDPAHRPCPADERLLEEVARNVGNTPADAVAPGCLCHTG